MNEILLFLQGKKTYIVSALLVVVAGLSYFGVIPDAETITAAVVGVAAIAVTLHAALDRAFKDVIVLDVGEEIDVFPDEIV